MQRSQAERMWMMGGGIIGLVALLIGWFFFISPQRSDTDDVNSQADSARSQNAGLEQRIATLKNQSQDLPKYQAQLAAARLALPGTSGLSDFLRTLQSIGSATLTSVTSVTVGTPSDASGSSSMMSGASSSSPSGSSGTSGSDSSSGGSSNGSSSNGSSTNGSTQASSSIYGLTISADASGSPAALTRFLQQLQTVQPRAVLINQIIEGSGSPDGTSQPTATTSLQLTMQAFVEPASPAENAQLAAAAHK